MSITKEDKSNMLTIQFMKEAQALLDEIKQECKAKDFPPLIVSTLLSDLTIQLLSIRDTYDSDKAISQLKDLTHFFHKKETCGLYSVDEYSIKSVYADWIDVLQVTSIIDKYIKRLIPIVKDLNLKRKEESDLINYMKVEDDYVFSQDY